MREPASVGYISMVYKGLERSYERLSSKFSLFSAGNWSANIFINLSEHDIQIMSWVIYIRYGTDPYSMKWHGHRSKEIIVIRIFTETLQFGSQIIWSSHARVFSLFSICWGCSECWVCGCVGAGCVGVRSPRHEDTIAGGEALAVALARNPPFWLRKSCDWLHPLRDDSCKKVKPETKFTEPG